MKKRVEELTKEEVNRLVHTKIFGEKPSVTWEVLDPAEYKSAFSSSFKERAVEFLKETLEKDPDSWMKDYHVGFREHYPDYCEPGRSIWRLMNKMAEEYHWCIRSPFEKGGKWFAGLTPLGTTGWNGRPDFECGSDSGPEAICRVALRAKLGEECEV